LSPQQDNGLTYRFLCHEVAVFARRTAHSQNFGESNGLQ
jgi:hypothetical protein